MILFHVEHLGGAWAPSPEDWRPIIEKAIAATVGEAGLCTVPPEMWDDDDYELSVALSDDAHVRALNREWREKDRATNVLSFPTEQIEAGGIPPHLMLGDLIFAEETCAREAVEQEKTFEAHFTHLVVHGLLHLYGYDHIGDEEAETMEMLERRILARLGIDDPYAQMNPRHRDAETGD